MDETKAITLLNNTSKKLLENARKCETLLSETKPKIKKAVLAKNLQGARMHVSTILKQRVTATAEVSQALRLKEIASNIAKDKNVNAIKLVLSFENDLTKLDLAKIGELTRDYDKDHGLLKNRPKYVTAIDSEEIDDYLYLYSEECAVNLPENFKIPPSNRKDELLELFEQYEKSFEKK